MNTRHDESQAFRCSAYPVHPVHPCSTSDRRRGVVLVIVVGLLAILMLMAGTLALLSRVGHQMSVTRDYGQVLDGLGDAVQAYAIGILYRDKYGTDGVPYSYDAWGTTFPGNPYPTPTDRSHYDDDEGFDSYINEEWLPNPGFPGTADPEWRLFPGRPYDQAVWESGAYGVRVDMNGDGAYDATNDWMVEWRRFADLGPTAGSNAALTGTDLAGRVSLYFEDLGGARIDVNATGNANNAQNQGLTPYETALDMVAVSAGGNMANAAAALIAARENGGTGTLPWLPLPLPGPVPRLDRDADGTIDALEADPTVYSPIYPDPTISPAYAPFDNYDLDDLFQMRNTGSRVAMRLNDPSFGANIPVSDFYLFTTNSAGTDLEGRAVASRDAFFNTGVDTTSMLNSSFFTRAGGHALPSKQPLNEIVTQLSPRELADFLESLDPVIRAGNVPVTGADRRRILRQVATNLKDMVDVDNTVSVWTGMDEGPDGIAGTPDDALLTYCGIEVTPYVVEGEVAVPTWYNVLSDTPATEMITGAGLTGKYIKLVNPWNVDIPLCDPSGNTLYRLVLPHEYPAGSGVPRLREWVYVPAGEHHTRIAVPHTSDVAINFPAGATVPARGHYLVADSQATVEALTGATPATLDPNYYTIEPGLQYTQESIGRPIGTEDVYKFLRYTPLNGGFDNTMLGATIYTWAPPAGSNVTATLRWVGNGVLLVEHGNAAEHFQAGEELFIVDPDPGPPPDPPRGTAVGVDEPIYDWFETPPDTPLSAESWLQTYVGNNTDPRVTARVGAEAGRPSALELFQVAADTYVMFTVLPDTTVTGSASYDDEDDWPLLADLALHPVQLSGQMDDPRPCWRRWNNVTNAPESAEAPGPAVNNPGPWGRNAWDRIQKQDLPWDSGDTTAASWFNANWAWSDALHDPDPASPPPYARNRAGDRWNALYGVDDSTMPPTVVAVRDDVRYSFPPVDPTDGWNTAPPTPVAEYTNVDRAMVPLPHETAVVNLGLLSTPGDIGFVHGGMPWTTISLGDYRQDNLVYLRNFLDYISAPLKPYESRSAWAGGCTFAPDQACPTGATPMAVAAADFNHDGLLDLASVDDLGSAVTVYFGLGGGEFGGRADYPLANGQHMAMAAADFDLGAGRDGYVDLLVPNESTNTVSILPGAAGGTFGPPASYTSLSVGNIPRCLTTGDFNGDGCPDIAVGNMNDDTVTVWLSQPGAGFTVTARADYAVGRWPRGIATGDFNGDGRLDLAVANNSDGTVTILLGQVGGTFVEQVGSPYTVGVGTQPVGIATADVNGDGLLDIATANGMDGTITVLYGQLAGGFGGAVTVPISGVGLGQGFALADVNGDGRPDAVVTNSNDSLVYVQFNDANGALGGPLVSYQAGNAMGLTCADLDANGTLDIAVADRLGAIRTYTNLGDASRVCGRVNVNTAPPAVLQAAMKQTIPSEPPGTAAQWIVDGRTPGDLNYGGPYTSVDDLERRMVARLVSMMPPGTPVVWGFRQEAFARFMCNTVTVRTDVWGIRARVQLFRDNGIDRTTGAATGTAGDGLWQNEEILSDQQFYMAVDRSQRPIRVLLKRYPGQ